jgi:DNA-binding NarL/FixJ family response regulator
MLTAQRLRWFSIPASCNVAPCSAWDPGQVPLRCLIVDDNASFLRAAAALLERQGLTVAGLASNGADALARACELRPDVVLLDIALGDESGFDVARRMVAADPAGAKIILISTHAEADFADLIDATPAAGFVPKAELSADAIQRLAVRPNAPRGT